MTISPSSARQDGFTLIEVLVAMVILAVGLLGLEALGIHAFRSVALAERNSRYATTASMYLEGAVGQLRLGKQPGVCQNLALSNGSKLSWDVVAVDGDRRNWRVTVSVQPASARPGDQPYSVTSHVFTPNPPAPGGPGCTAY